MNVNLLYQGNNYNFDLRKDIDIKYIYGLASKLISKDISTFELFYKNENLSDYQESTLLKDLANDNNNINITISSKDSINLLSSDKIKKLKKIKDFEQTKNSVNINDLKIMLTTPPIISSINSRNKNPKKPKKSLEYISENKVFEDIYNSKENEIICLMNDLSQKLKEYDDVLYKIYKNKSERSNNEVTLYEKNIIDFKNSQISFLKKLLKYFKTSEKNFLSGELSLTDFYIELKQYNNPKTINITKSNFNKKKNN